MVAIARVVGSISLVHPNHLLDEIRVDNRTITGDLYDDGRVHGSCGTYDSIKDVVFGSAEALDALPTAEGGKFVVLRINRSSNDESVEACNLAEAVD
jgi:hypothetical protein